MSRREHPILTGLPIHLVFEIQRVSPPPPHHEAGVGLRYTDPVQLEQPLRAIKALRAQLVVPKGAQQLRNQDVGLLGRLPHAHVGEDQRHDLAPPLLLDHGLHGYGKVWRATGAECLLGVDGMRKQHFWGQGRGHTSDGGQFTLPGVTPGCGPPRWGSSRRRRSESDGPTAPKPSSRSGPEGRGLEGAQRQEEVGGKGGYERGADLIEGLGVRRGKEGRGGDG